AGPGEAAIFEAHLLFLQDASLLGPAREAVHAGSSSAAAWDGTVERVAAEWTDLADEYQRGRVEDLRSVGRRVLAHVLGVPPPRPALEGPGILVTRDLTPADAASLDPRNALGIATAAGGATSHASILA